MKHIYLMCMVSLTAGIAMAAETVTPQDEKHKAAAPFYGGLIEPKRVDEFIEQYSKEPIDRVVIASQGGDGEAGIKLGNWIKDRNLDVEVQTICMSACANFLFTAGRRKYISKYAMIIWHGGMEQADIRDHQQKYDDLFNRPLVSLSQDERDYLEKERFRYEVTKRLRKLQTKFFARVGVNEYVTRLGQEPKRYKSDGWTVSLDLMKNFGIADVIADHSDYGSHAYLGKNPVAVFANQGPLLVFGLSGSGEVIPVENFGPP